jgi:hypothetical protein
MSNFIQIKAVRREKKSEPNRTAIRRPSNRTDPRTAYPLSEPNRTEPRISADNRKKFNLIKSRELNQ